jgi:Protein of unknown function (DUF2946)
MFGAFHKRSWRCAIGVIALYALLLQAFLAASMAAQAAAQGDPSYSGSLFVICTVHDDGATVDGADVPAKQAAHCPVCTFSGSAAALLPEPELLPIRQDVATGRTPFVSVAACISFHQARAGLSRAPPQNA